MEINKDKRNTRSIRARLCEGIGALAVLIFGAAIGSYLVIAGFTSDPVLAIGTAGVFASITTVIFGRIFAERIASSVDAAKFAAMSSERNPTANTPAATGISETDDILLCLHRSSRQLISYASLMEMVASGNTAEAVIPLDSPDRLTTSFQKLIQKVAESVNAKHDLDELRYAIEELEAQLPGLFERRPYREISGAPAVATITAALNEIAARADRESRAAKNRISTTESILLSANLGVRNGMLASDASMRNLSRAVSALKSMPDHVKTIAEVCEPASVAAEKAASSLLEGIEACRSIAGNADHVQRHQNELNRKLRKLRERSQSICDAARAVEDLARRSNLLALNTSIQADSRSASSAISDEFRSLSDRAQRVQKEITDIERSLSHEIEDADTILRFLLAESADVNVQLASVLELVEMFEPVLNGLAGVPDLIREIVNKSSRDREELTRIVTSCYFDLEKIGPHIRETEHAIKSARTVFEEVFTELQYVETAGPNGFDSPIGAGQHPLELTGEN
jgi:methyl-accepting chemotaxis protein